MCWACQEEEFYRAYLDQVAKDKAAAASGKPSPFRADEIEPQDDPSAEKPAANH